MQMEKSKVYYPNYFRQFSERSSIVLEFSKRLGCSLCNKIMIEPVQTECGCRFCNICIINYINEANVECLNCQEGIIEKSKLIKDTAVEKEIMSLMVKCINSGCGITSAFKEIQNHLSSCDYKQVQCNKCDETYQQSKRQEHIIDKCMESIISCEDCGVEMKRKDYDDIHKSYESNEENICGMWLRDCPYYCNEEKLFNIRIHLRNCPKKPNECPFKDFNCNIKGTNEYIKIHVQKDIISHNLLLMSEIKNLRVDNDKIKQSYLENKKTNEIKLKKSKEIILETTRTVGKLFERVDEMEIQMKSFSDEINKFRMQSSSITFGQSQATWYIKDIRKKIQEAKCGGKNELISECFYIFRPGYNMSLKVFLNGDGRATNKYLSVFFVVYKGEYDSQISWPFKSIVLLSILSNSHGKKDVTVRMKPNNNDECYGKPSGKCNLGAGQPELVELSEILNKDYYLHDGALKLRLGLVNV